MNTQPIHDNFSLFFNRKEIHKSNYLEDIDNKMSAITKRQNIMRHFPDTISDNELRTHKNQLILKKFSFWTVALGTPVLAYFCKFSNRNALLLTLLGYGLASSIYYSRTFSKNCPYSSEFAVDSLKKSYIKLLNINGIAAPHPALFWSNLNPETQRIDFSDAEMERIKRV